MKEVRSYQEETVWHLSITTHNVTTDAHTWSCHRQRHTYDPLLSSLSLNSLPNCILLTRQKQRYSLTMIKGLEMGEHTHTHTNWGRHYNNANSCTQVLMIHFLTCIRVCVCFQFYSVLDGDEDMIFMHVDNPGGTVGERSERHRNSLKHTYLTDTLSHTHSSLCFYLTFSPSLYFTHSNSHTHTCFSSTDKGHMSHMDPSLD